MFSATSVRSESTVDSPISPLPRTRNPLPRTRNPLPGTPESHTTWQNSDYPLAAGRVPRMVSAAPVTPTAHPIPAPAANPAAQIPAAEPKPSRLRRAILGAGAFLGSFGVVGGFISIIGLGPLGLAVAGGAAVAAAILLKLGASIR